jgi:adenine phosphoribosyltransferase
MSQELKKYIRNVKDFPKKGIVFRDITPLLMDPKALKLTSKELFELVKNKNVNKVAAIESRGFLFGIVLADKLDAGFVPIRKPGKLPAETVKETYMLEYGEDAVEIHKDAIEPGDKVLIHDDLLATGGTAAAACKLIEKLGGIIVQVSFIIELSFLNGRRKLKDYDIRALVDYDSE